MLGYTDLIEDLPEQIRSLLFDLRNDRLTLNLEHHRLDRLTTGLEHASRNISRALIIAAFMIGSAILVLADSGDGSMGWLTLLGVFGVVVALAWTTVMLIGSRFWSR